MELLGRKQRQIEGGRRHCNILDRFGQKDEDTRHRCIAPSACRSGCRQRGFSRLASTRAVFSPLAHLHSSVAQFRYSTLREAARVGNHSAMCMMLATDLLNLAASSEQPLHQHRKQQQRQSQRRRQRCHPPPCRMRFERPSCCCALAPRQR